MAHPKEDDSSVLSEESDQNFSLPSLNDLGDNEDWDGTSEFKMGDVDNESLEFRSRFSTNYGNDDARLKSYFSRRTTIPDSNMMSKRLSMKSAFTRSDFLTDSNLVQGFQKIEIDLTKLDLLRSDNSERASNADWTNLSPKESFELVEPKKKAKVAVGPKKKSEASRKIWFKMTKENQSVNTKTSPGTRKTGISFNKKRDSAKINSFAEEQTSPDTLERERNVKIKSDGEKGQTTVSRKSKESFVSKFINIRLKKVSRKKSNAVTLKKKPIWATVKLRKINGVKRSFLWTDKNEKDWEGSI